jgi:Icc-related predicted phosphoesterase
MSDTHGHHKKHKLVPADIFIHAGDFCNEGTEEEIDEFIDFLKSLPHPNKIVIGGNHEVSLDPKCATFELRQRTDPKPVPTEEIKKRLKEACTYLVDESTSILGLSFWASPTNISMGAFGLPRSSARLQEKWRTIPDNLDILITHGPPAGDRSIDRFGRAHGDEDLLMAVKKIKPVLHICGHFHEGYGVSVIGEEPNTTHVVNAANVHRNNPIVIDIVL